MSDAQDLKLITHSLHVWTRCTKPVEPPACGSVAAEYLIPQSLEPSTRTANELIVTAFKADRNPQEPKYLQQCPLRRKRVKSWWSGV